MVHAPAAGASANLRPAGWREFLQGRDAFPKRPGEWTENVQAVTAFHSPTILPDRAQHGPCLIHPARHPESKGTHKIGRLRLLNGRGEEAMKIENLNADALGTIATEVIIPKDAPLVVSSCAVLALNQCDGRRPPLHGCIWQYLAGIWPLVRALAQPSPHRIFPHVDPLLRMRFLAAQQMIEESLLPVWCGDSLCSPMF